MPTITSHSALARAFFYVYFAKEMNAKDDCGYGWAYIEEGVIVWDEKLTVADPDSYCVLDTETTDRIMPVGHVAVSEAYRANAERLILRASLQDNKHTRIREQKKALKERDSGPDIHTADAKDAFARKRKAIKDAAIATAAKKAKIAADEAAGPSGAPADGSTDNSMVFRPTRAHTRLPQRRPYTHARPARWMPHCAGPVSTVGTESLVLTPPTQTAVRGASILFPNQIFPPSGRPPHSLYICIHALLSATDRKRGLLGGSGYDPGRLYAGAAGTWDGVEWAGTGEGWQPISAGGAYSTGTVKVPLLTQTAAATI
ncbi:hypothetical protein C8R44DRAFT_943242 [Mycena epipterygia]|nr:hypothetical protein C8R44DRAFT_943242 [Mycena epipterygia]